MPQQWDSGRQDKKGSGAAEAETAESKGQRPFGSWLCEEIKPPSLSLCYSHPQNTRVQAATAEAPDGWHPKFTRARHREPKVQLALRDRKAWRQLKADRLALLGAGVGQQGRGRVQG